MYLDEVLLCREDEVSFVEEFGLEELEGLSSLVKVSSHAHLGVVKSP